MNTSFKAIGLALTTVLCSTQTQALQTSNVSTSYVLASVKPCERRVGVAATFSEYLKKLREKLKMLSLERSAIDDILSGIYMDVNSSQRQSLPDTVVILAKNALVQVEETIMISQVSFDKIMSEVDSNQLQDAIELRSETIRELDKVIVSLNNIIELDVETKMTCSEEFAPAVIYDIARMENALKSDIIQAPAGMTREEKRKFILSHAS